MGRIARFVGLQHPREGHVKCFLGVSYGPEYYRGESLDAIVTLVSQTFDHEHRIVMFADTLNAYNLMIRDETSLMTLEEARTQAERDGSEWLTSPDGRKLGSLGPIIRWRDIITDPNFEIARIVLRDLYLTKGERKPLEKNKDNPEIERKLSYSEAMDRVVGERIAVLKASMDQAHFDLQRFRPLVRSYLEEEAAGELLIAQRYPCEYEAYPGERSGVAMWVHKNLISKEHPHILRWLTIKISPPSRLAQSSVSSAARRTQSTSLLSDLSLFVTGNQDVHTPRFEQVDFIHMGKLIEKFFREINGKLLLYQRLVGMAQINPRSLQADQRAELIRAIEFLTAWEQRSSSPCLPEKSQEHPISPQP